MRINLPFRHRIAVIAVVDILAFAAISFLYILLLWRMVFAKMGVRAAMISVKHANLLPSSILCLLNLPSLTRPFGAPSPASGRGEILPSPRSRGEGGRRPDEGTAGAPLRYLSAPTTPSGFACHPSTEGNVARSALAEKTRRLSVRAADGVLRVARTRKMRGHGKSGSAAEFATKPGEGGPCLCPECFDRLLSERVSPGA
jgi:hypothetical protein